MEVAGTRKEKEEREWRWRGQSWEDEGVDTGKDAYADGLEITKIGMYDEVFSTSFSPLE
jgi:hypothetical protein